MTPTGERFERREHIRKRAEFQRVYEKGVRLRGRLATMFVLENSGQECRLGIAATKRLGDAVRRNRAKRLIREVFRRNKPHRGLDIVIVPGRELLNASLSAIETEYCQHLERRFKQFFGTGRRQNGKASSTTAPRDSSL